MYLIEKIQNNYKFCIKNRKSLNDLQVKSDWLYICTIERNKMVSRKRPVNNHYTVR